MIDCGADWLGKFQSVFPCIVLTHGHDDHAKGLANGAPCPDYATAETWELISKYTLTDRRIMLPRTPLPIDELIFAAFPVDHSLRAPAVGYRMTAGRYSFFYVPDDVSDAGHELLIHQNKFDIALNPRHGRLECGEIKTAVKHIRPQSLVGDKFCVVFDEPDAHNHSLVDVCEATVIDEVEAHPSEGWLFVLSLHELKRAGHPEMQGQPAAAIDLCHEMLAVTAGCNKGSALQAGSECSGREFPEDSGIRDNRPIDCLAQGILREHAFETLDVRQFRHLVSLRLYL
jgi:hypothetical protein